MFDTKFIPLMHFRSSPLKVQLLSRIKNEIIFLLLLFLISLSSSLLSLKLVPALFFATQLVSSRRDSRYLVYEVSHMLFLVLPLKLSTSAKAVFLSRYLFCCIDIQYRTAKVDNLNKSFCAQIGGRESIIEHEKKQLAQTESHFLQAGFSQITVFVGNMWPTT